MSLISLIEASKDYGVRNLFQGLNLHINPGDKLGLIGANGTGKSTLLKILAGIEPLGQGQRKCSPKLNIELINQASKISTERSVIEEVLANCGEKRELLLRFNQLSTELAKTPEDTKLLKDLGQISERMDSAAAWRLEQECKEILQRLGIKDLNRPVKELSGGYQKRVGLAAALVSKPDVLLLDEPTNHLDASSVQWLQSWLEKFRGTLVLVTHDRYVLDQITERMVEVSNGEVHNYNGNYSTFLKQKTQKEIAEASIEAKFKGILRKELAWLKKGPKARSTKQKARIKRIEEMQNKSSTIINNSLKISTSNKRIGKLVIEAEDLQISTNGNQDGTLLFKDFSYSFSKEDRVGIIGSNGIGKSTLLDLISGKRLPTGGKLRIGETVSLGYLDQQTNDLMIGKGLDRKVIDFVEEASSLISLGKEQITASQLLERFLFPPAKQHSPLKLLSGGEKRRLTLCRILIKAPNVLLLDEPTNDLDVQTLSVLEDFLEDFKGCVVIVSHDRYFLDRTVDRIFNFEEGKIKQYEGNYSSFLEKKQLQEKSLPESSQANNYIKKSEASIGKQKSYITSPNGETRPKSTKDSRKARRRSFKESKELSKLDKELPLLESQKSSLENSLTKDKGNLTSLSEELAATIEKLKQAEDRWLELSELDP